MKDQYKSPAMGSPDYERMKGSKAKDMYDLMPPFPSASIPADNMKGIQGNKKTTGKKVAPKEMVKTGDYKKSYSKDHPAQKKITSVEDIRSAAKKRKSDSYS